FLIPTGPTPRCSCRLLITFRSESTTPRRPAAVPVLIRHSSSDATKALRSWPSRGSRELQIALRYSEPDRRHSAPENKSSRALSRTGCCGSSACRASPSRSLRESKFAAFFDRCGRTLIDQFRQVDVLRVFSSPHVHVAADELNILIAAQFEIGVNG